MLFASKCITWTEYKVNSFGVKTNLQIVDSHWIDLDAYVRTIKPMKYQNEIRACFGSTEKLIVQQLGRAEPNVLNHGVAIQCAF